MIELQDRLELLEKSWRLIKNEYYIRSTSKSGSIPAAT